jgi:hypothetical protein
VADFVGILSQIEAQGLLVKNGTLIDATIVKAAAKAPKGDDGALSDVDPEAGWTKKTQRLRLLPALNRDEHRQGRIAAGSLRARCARIPPKGGTNGLNGVKMAFMALRDGVSISA